MGNLVEKVCPTLGFYLIFSVSCGNSFFFITAIVGQINLLIINIMSFFLLASAIVFVKGIEVTPSYLLYAVSVP